MNPNLLSKHLRYSSSIALQNIENIERRNSFFHKKNQAKNELKKVEK